MSPIKIIPNQENSNQTTRSIDNNGSRSTEATENLIRSLTRHEEDCRLVIGFDQKISLPDNPEYTALMNKYRSEESYRAQLANLENSESCMRSLIQDSESSGSEYLMSFFSHYANTLPSEMQDSFSINDLIKAEEYTRSHMMQDQNDTFNRLVSYLKITSPESKLETKETDLLLAFDREDIDNVEQSKRLELENNEQDQLYEILIKFKNQAPVKDYKK